MSVFLQRPEADHVAANALAFAIRDGFPVSPGHTLVIPRRLVATWFEATREEQLAVLELVDVVKAQLDAELKPDGYNIGINAGVAAGQTVMHLHVHLIPRYRGDVADPRGGVRHLMPGKGNYLAPGFEASAARPGLPRAEALVTGGRSDPFLTHLQRLFPAAEDISILVAFAQPSGVAKLWSLVQQALKDGARLRVITGDYLGITHPHALTQLLSWTASELGDGPRPEVRVVETARLPTASKSFHPKSWLLVGRDFGVAFVGSSNVSKAALDDGIEWNLRIERERDPAGFARVVEAFEDLWPQAAELTSAWIQQYKLRVPVRSALARDAVAEDQPEALAPAPEPHSIQLEALQSLVQAREQGRERGLVVMATGLGKTWLAGFELQALQKLLRRTPRVLWLAHREELLQQAADVIGRALGDVSVGFFAGNKAELGAQVVMASVAKLSRPEHLARLALEQFDYAVVDEVHHAAAKSYRAVLAALRAEFVLGLTATPDRTDQADIQALLDDHLAFDAGLHRGIEEGLLASFAYYGLADTVEYKNIPWRNGRFDPLALAQAVETEARMQRAWQGWQEHPGERTLVFCCTIAHATYVCHWLGAKGVRAVAVHSQAGTADRGEALRRLEAGELDAVCAVDLFNEGIDVPSIDRVVMLRPSESPVVFLQQLGRGLRRAPGKERLTVIDFVGNHKVFLRRLGALRDISGWVPGREGLANWLQMAARSATSAELPPGCSVQVALEAVALLEKLWAKQAKPAPKQMVEQFVEDYGRRPTAVEFFHRGGNPQAASKGGWFQFLRQEGLLSDAESQVANILQEFLAAIEKTDMTKSYKAVVLAVLAENNAVRDGMTLAELSAKSLAWLRRHPELLRDVQDVKALGDIGTIDAVKWQKYWQTWPIAKWCGSPESRSRAQFRLDGDRFVVNHPTHGADAAVLTDMVGELADWCLDKYRRRPQSQSSVAAGASAFECELLHNRRHAILKHPGQSSPWANTVLHARVPGGELWRFSFAAEYCNVAYPAVSTGARNQLGDLLVLLFGEHAGQPGTDFRLRFEQDGDDWRAVAVGREDARVLPLVPRVKVRALPSLRVAAGWLAGAVTDEGLEELEEVELPGPIPDGCVAVRVSGESMAGWRSEIRDGDWLVLRPAAGVGFGAVEGQVVVLARGDAEARTVHVKRVVRGDGGRWWLRSDNSEVAAVDVVEGDEVFGVVVRVLEADEVGHEVHS